MKIRQVVGLALVVLLSGCATQYQRQSFTGGFTETQLDHNVYRVTFKGNGYTSAERAADLSLLRCAELTIEKGYAYFAVVDSRENTSHSTFTTPTQSYTTGSAYASGRSVYGSATTTTYGGHTYLIAKPSSSNTIVLIKNRDEFQGYSYDAKFLFGSLSAQYGVEKK